MGKAIWTGLRAIGRALGVVVLAGIIGAGIGLGAVVVLSFFGI